MMLGQYGMRRWMIGAIRAAALSSRKRLADTGSPLASRAFMLDHTLWTAVSTSAWSITCTTTLDDWAWPSSSVTWGHSPY